MVPIVTTITKIFDVRD